MSLFRRDLGGSDMIWQGLPTRTPRRQGSVDVTADSAMSHSAAWAAMRLRADLVSSFPVVCYRKMSDGTELTVPTPQVLIAPCSHGDGQPLTVKEWLYSSQVDLDRSGNSFGVIRARDGQGLAKVIEPVRCELVTVAVRGGKIDHYKIGGLNGGGQEIVQPADMWHERQFTISGLHVGLSAVSYAAQSLGSYLSAQQFAVDWFSNGAVPGAILKNVAKTLTPEVATSVKKKFQASITNGDVFVTGNDWDYQMIQATAAQSAFLEAMEYGLVDIARFFGVPADMIDAGSAKSTKIVYANMTQRNLQFLIMHLAPALARREEAFSRLLSAPRNVRFDTSGLQRMDPAGAQAVLASKIAMKQVTPSEARAEDNRTPYTEAQIQEIERLYGAATAVAPSMPLPEPPKNPEGAVK